LAQELRLSRYLHRALVTKLRSTVAKSSVKEMIARIGNLVQCPVIWDSTDRSSELVDEMVGLWEDTCKRHQCEQEADWALEDSVNEQLYDDEQDYDVVASDLAYLEHWIPIARAEYVDATRRFWNLRVAGPDEYDKHYPHAREDVPAIRKRTRGRQTASVLYPGVSAAHLGDALWMELCILIDRAKPDDSGGADNAYAKAAGIWKKIVQDDRVRVALHSTSVVGASEGEDTQWLCFELNASSQIAHAYPISEAKALGIMDGLILAGQDEIEQAGAANSEGRKHSVRPWGKLRS
jgi:hypothetical protein